MLLCLQLNVSKQNQVPRLLRCVSLSCCPMSIMLLAHLFVPPMSSGRLLFQLVWSLKISWKRVESALLSRHSFSPLGSKWDWLPKSLWKVQREPKVLSAPECSFQAGCQARKQPVMAQGVPRTSSAQLCFGEAGVFLQPRLALCCSLEAWVSGVVFGCVGFSVFLMGVSTS